MKKRILIVLSLLVLVEAALFLSCSNREFFSGSRVMGLICIDAV